MEKVSLKYEAYTDGSCDNLSPYGEGGSAYIILKDGIIIKESKKGFVGTTNNRMEMLAIISAVKSVPKGATLTGIHRFSILYNELYELQETQKELRLNKPLSSLRRITP